MSEPYFKAADERDAQQLIAFMRELNAHDHIPFDEAAARAAIKQILEDERLGRVYLITLEGEAIGYVALTLGFSFEFHGRDAFVDELFVATGYRGQGFGRKALEFVEQVCREMGVRALHLEVTRDNTRALDLYKKYGFKDHDRYLMTKWVVNQ